MDEHELGGGAVRAGNRAHLRAVAYRMLGSRERGRRRRPGGVAAAQPRRHRARSRTCAAGSRPSSPRLPRHAARAHGPAARSYVGTLAARADRQLATSETDPEHEALLADSVGLALLVVLETLTPAERLAFVLHDMFAVPFDEIAPIVGRSPAAARQLASRARRRVRGAAPDAGSPTSRSSARSSTPSWPPRARATSTRSSPCSTPTWSSGSTAGGRRAADAPAVVSGRRGGGTSGARARRRRSHALGAAGDRQRRRRPGRRARRHGRRGRRLHRRPTAASSRSTSSLDPEKLRALALND